MRIAAGTPLWEDIMGFVSQPPAWRMAPWSTFIRTHCASDHARAVRSVMTPLDAPPSVFTKDSWQFDMPEIAPTAFRAGLFDAPRTKSMTSPLAEKVLLHSVDAGLTASQAYAIIDRLFVEASHYNFERRAAGAQALAHLYTLEDDTKKSLRTLLASPANIARTFEVCVGTLHAAHLPHLWTHATIPELARTLISCLRTLCPLLSTEYDPFKGLLRVALQEIAEDIDAPDTVELARATLLELFPHASRTRPMK